MGPRRIQPPRRRVGFFVRESAKKKAIALKMERVKDWVSRAARED